MSAEVLREAARLMRSRAGQAAEGPWVQNGFEYDDVADSFTYDIGTADDPVVSLAYAGDRDDAEHIASWHPDVASAVADWLDLEAENTTRCSNCTVSHRPDHHHWAAYQVARAYLGDPS